MGFWTLDDIPWERFERRLVDPNLVPIVKAASLIEGNGAAYAHHLCRIFEDDPGFQESARHWGEDEVRHALALGRWACLADPQFDFELARTRFQEGYRVDFDHPQSRRGSRSGELVARCIVETGTTSYYSALREATREPVLREICRRIAADELRHYKLFYSTLKRQLERERLGFWARLAIALGRIREVQDDELAYAYHAANEVLQSYNRRRSSRAYARRAYATYRRQHVDSAIAMIFKAVGLRPNGWLSRATSALAWQALRFQASRLARRAA